MPDSSRLTVALVAKLQTDAALLALMPDNAWLAEAPAGKTRFVIVALVDESDEAVFGRRAFEDALYLVEARALSTSGGNVHAAYARIDALLEDGTLTVPGYGLMALYRDGGFVDTVEVDQVDPTIRWNRCGGHYRITATPN
jgi:predicted PhzF superfamily epimerase YddE/YHI9